MIVVPAVQPTPKASNERVGERQRLLALPGLSPFGAGPMPIVIPVIAGGALITGLLMGSSLWTEVMILGAVVPGLFVLDFIVRSDRFPEPAGLLLVTFVLGALITFPVVAAERAIGEVVTELLKGRSAEWLWRDLSLAFLEAGFCEELGKFLVLTFVCMHWDAFDEPIDGIVYGATTALGFAVLENVLYVSRASGILESLAAAMIRAVTAVPAHAADGAVMGFFIGLSRARPGGRRLFMAAGLAVPISLHGAYDFLAFANDRLPGYAAHVWWWLFAYEIHLAARMIGKLRGLQWGESVDDVIRGVRSRMGLAAEPVEDARNDPS